MLVNFGAKILDKDGKDILVNTGENLESITLYSLALSTLMQEKAEGLTVEEKLSRFKLIQKLKNEEVDLPVEEVALLKKLIGEIHNSWLVGKSYELLG